MFCSKLVPWLLAGILGVALIPAPGRADPAGTLPYYGYLAEQNGSPVADGPYELRFRISLTSSVISAAVWSETHPAVPVENGRFYVELGSILPLPLAFDDDWFLWLVVDGTQTMLPKQILGMSPHAMTLCLPYSGGASISGDAFTVGNSGAGSAVQTEGDLEVGTTTQTGTSLLYQSGGALIGKVGAYSNTGGQANINSENSSVLGSFQVVGPGARGTLSVNSEGGNGIAFVDTNPSGEPYLGLWGVDRDFIVAMDGIDSDQVQMPGSALSALETFNETGCAARFVNTSQGVQSTVSDLSSQAIVVPSSGYVLALGTVMIQNFTSYFGYYGVSTSPDTFPSNQQVALFLSGVDYQIPLTVSGLFPVSAGVNTFYLLGQSFGAGTQQDAQKAQLTLLFIPTAYGTIQATASSGPVFEVEGSQASLDAAEEPYRSDADNQARIRTELEEQAIRLSALRGRWSEMQRATRKSGGGDQ